MFHLCCWTCKNTLPVDGNAPETPLELAVVAKSKGWGVVTDSKNSAWVVCSQSCHDNAWIKEGRFPALGDRNHQNPLLLMDFRTRKITPLVEYIHL